MLRTDEEGTIERVRPRLEALLAEASQWTQGK